MTTTLVRQRITTGKLYAVVSVNKSVITDIIGGDDDDEIKADDIIDDVSPATFTFYCDCNESSGAIEVWIGHVIFEGLDDGRPNSIPYPSATLADIIASFVENESNDKCYDVDAIALLRKTIEDGINKAVTGKCPGKSDGTGCLNPVQGTVP